jgi:hypothetical protein
MSPPSASSVASGSVGFRTALALLGGGCFCDPESVFGVAGRAVLVRTGYGPPMIDQSASNDDTAAAAALKARRRTAGKRSAVPDPAPVDSSPGLPALPMASSGISHHSLGGPSTVVGSFVSEGVSHASAGDYVVPEQDGFYAYYERGARQPTCVRAWTAGQRVRKDHYERYGGAQAPANPRDTRPLNEPGGGLST